MSTIRVNQGDNLQDALNNAQGGDILELASGASWQGDYNLPDKGDAGLTITCEADKLPEAGKRVTLEQSQAMPRIIGGTALRCLARARNYSIRGLRLGTYENYYTMGMVELGDPACTVEEDLPRDITMEHCWLQADLNCGGKRGIFLNCVNGTIRDSVVTEFWSDFQDSQAICGTNGPGPYLIENNQLTASGENIMFGGACPSIHGLIPSDITVRGNWLYKPLEWKTSLASADLVGSYQGRPRLVRRPDPARAGEFRAYFKAANVKVKNLFELKNARNVLIEKNIFENNWSSAQAGFGIQLTVRTCEAGDYAWATVSEVVFQDNLVISENGVNILGCDGARENCGEPKYAGSARDLVFRRNYIQASWCWQILSATQRVLIEDNSCDSNYGAMLAFDTMPEISVMDDLLVQRNKLKYGTGIVGSGAGPGKQALDAYWDSWQFTENAVWGVPSGDLWWVTQPEWYPAGNLYVVTEAEVTPQEEYGCDVEELKAILAHVRDGQTSSSPQPPANPLAMLTVHQSLAPGQYEVRAPA